ncbi:unnamed protein product [Musa acuminata subsp. malaccensis]|uniref:(wild Malaysian banana) hypothetical protein n=1 Tax=Musa acuminata subsp. malaccensis TaxID=214687 RepID=A0A8D7EZ90_MUSAM|nr:unnamed protein product [Musa acuminata subsp. malaccensis]
MSRKLVWRRRTAEGFYRPAGQLPSVAALGFCRRARFLVPLSPPQPSEKWRRRGRDGVGVFEIGNFGIDACHEGSRRAEAKALPPSKTPHAGLAVIERLAILVFLKLQITLSQVCEEIQSIFLQMGFEEMPTNNFVESSFWNFDALFQPQQHPAHDSHGTFFFLKCFVLADPGSRRSLPDDYVERVKLVLESGGYGSKGYGYDWKGKKLIRISFGHTQLQFLLEYFTCLLSRANRWKMEPHS